MLSILRYSSVVFLYYPLIIAATWAGGYWPLIYLVGAIGMYVVLDNLAAPLTATQSARLAAANDLYLFLHIPHTLVLFAVLLVKIRLMGALGPSMTVLGLRLAPFANLREVLVATVAIGVHFGTNNVAAHELMHRSAPFWRACSRILLVMTGDPQFQEAHLYGHHSTVGTPDDPATARQGETFYRFLVRSTLGQWAEAYRYESFRLRKRGSWARWAGHRVLRGNLATLGLLGATWWLCGPLGVAAYLLVMLLVKSGLESANYIQHYGLTRDPRSKVEAHHSWDCDGRGSSMYMYNLTRHADHHAVPRRQFWALGASASGYRLPHGYMVALFLALFPPIWFRYADRLLDEGSKHLAAGASAPDGDRV